jgi:CubicO group peptidase (beta-lactamase class C family)
MPEPVGIDGARTLLRLATAERHLFPAAVAEFGSSGEVIWREAFGTLSFSEHAAPVDAHTIFDLASLTKPIATASVTMQLVARDLLVLDHPVADFFPEWRGGDRAAVSVRDLLEHASGLPARLVDPPPAARREFEHDICTMPLEYRPRSMSLYSDLGFLLLGFLVSDVGKAGLDTLFGDLAAAIRPEGGSSGVAEVERMLTFHVPSTVRGRTAPTQPQPADARRGRTLIGEVHDDYAALLGGVAGHAGLFGTAAGVGTFARTILRAARGDESTPHPFSPDVVARMTRRSSVPGSSRALGWDTMLPTSSCGTFMSAGAFGHVGFTGTSLWIDPPRDRYYVLLTNRVARGGTVEEMAELRRGFHDILTRV